MQRRRDAPNDPIPNQTRQPEREEVAHERGTRELAERDGGPHTGRNRRDVALRLLPRRDGSLLGLLRGRRRRDDRRRRHRARCRREAHAVVQHDGPADDLVLQVDRVLAVAADREQELGDVVRVERGRLRGEPGREVRVANDGDALVGVGLARLGHRTVTTSFSSEVDDD